jgi:hypothetical protein
MRKAILSLLLLAGCSPSDRKQPLTHDAYIWQRRWNVSVTQAVRESAPSIHAWRVLAAEVNAAGEWLPVAANQESLRNSAKPVIAVIRTSRLDDHLSTKAAALAAQWNVRGIEIDYDCGTESLPSYRDFLRQLRATLSRRYSLSITALPSWLASHDLPALLSEVDESVLQVHSVLSPKQGLFNKTIAADWARKWSAQTTRPFLIALPTYWSRVSWNQAGRVTAIESEAARLGTDETTQELFVEPGEVISFMAEIQKNPPPHLQGIAWFRLPTNQDERAWDAATWHAVMQGRAVPPAHPVIRIQADASGAQDVYLLNQESLAARLPSEVLVSAQGCQLADAMPGYTLETQQDGFRFRLQAQDVLRPRQRKLVGWVRCTGKDLTTRVSF